MLQSVTSLTDDPEFRAHKQHCIMSTHSSILLHVALISQYPLVLMMAFLNELYKLTSDQNKGKYCNIDMLCT